MFRKKYNKNGGVFRSKTNINFANNLQVCVENFQL